ncbi:MAG: HAMP domain-containing sensor histidine kinase [Microbacterium sp.]|nr:MULTISPECIES: HAMP domain-containing sensor histidine kinase [unclassified Microbacterium]MDO8384278.1 HAMP domain-containing sensor histidine kinase [Microbacterium sp.]
MAILAIGLFASGIATMAFVRNALVVAQDEQLQARASSNLGAGLLDVEIDEDNGTVKISLTDQAVAGDYFIAVYEAEGESLGGRPSGDGPNWPEEYTLEKTISLGTTPFTLYDDDGAVYHASAGTLDPGLNGQLYTQVIAQPLAPIDRTVATFFGVFTILGLITIAAGALTTRLLVTQTFRPLGQVERAATSISSGDFSQRLTPGDPRTEVGKLTGALNTMLDRVDASLSQREATVRQMRRFIGDASHELRTPLVTVRGYAELYRIGAIRGDEDTAQAMERIEKEAIRMGVLVEDLLALARLDERREVEIAPIDLRPIARDAGMDLRAAAPQRTVTVIDADSLAARIALEDDGATGTIPVDTDPAEKDASAPRRRGGASSGARARSLLRRIPRPIPAPRGGSSAGAPGSPAQLSFPTKPIPVAVSRPPVVLGDENRIRQVVANLLGNARRFTADDSPIEIVVGTDVTAVSETAPLGMGWVAIVDHGEGIPEQIRDNIFQRFWRADSSRTRETGGSGLGLAIVASIVAALNGTVEVEDTPGGGATFRVSFPIAPESTLYLDTQPLPELPPRPPLP